MDPNVGAQPPATPVPLSGHAALIADHLRQRRPGLWEHSRSACELAAAALAEIHEAARGHVAALRADRSARYRDGQLTGERLLGVEDMAAVALESEAGRASVVAGVRVLLSAFGLEVVEREQAELSTPAHHLGAMATAAGRMVAAVALVVEDGRVEPHEAAGLRPQFSALKADVQRLEQALNVAASAPGCDPRFLRRAGGAR